MSLHLTFDDGPSEWTPQILDLLAEHDAKATFFVVGENVDGLEGVVMRAAYEGHTVGNHTWSHPRLTDHIQGAVWQELRRTQRLVGPIIGGMPVVWRAPYYATDERIDAIAREFGLTHMGADIVPEDCFTDDVDQIALRVLAGMPFVDGRPAVVSLHDGIPPDGGSSSCTQSRQPTVDAVRIILETLA